MPFNLLLLPLLGGYLFVNRFNRLRFLAERSDGYRFLFESSLAGLFLLGLSELIVIALRPSFVSLDIAFHKILPMSGSGVTTLAFLLGLFLPLALNRFFNISTEVERAIEIRGQSFEQIFDAALRTQKEIQLILKNNKVYVGLITSWPGILSKDDAITLLPLYEGYQESETKKIQLTIEYDSLFAKVDKNIAGLSINDLKDAAVAVLVSEIQAVSFFNMRIYAQQLGRGDLVNNLNLELRSLGASPLLVDQNDSKSGQKLQD